MREILKKIKRIIKLLTPAVVFSFYHLLLAYLGAVRYGFPARRMVIIGIIGTRGKTTIGNLIWSCLTSAGYKVGLTGTANIRVGDSERMNPYHMTMPGRFRMQKILREMADAGCQFAIVETPSEGVEQWRHKCIAYDAVVLASLYPEYLAIHGWSFDRAKEMDEKPFHELLRQPRKDLNGKKVPKIIVVDTENEDWERFFHHSADIKIRYALNPPADISPEKIEEKGSGSVFFVGKTHFEIKLPGRYNIKNALAAIATASAFEVKQEAIQKGLLLEGIPGRMEVIDCGQPYSVFVDYAHDAVSLEAVLPAVRTLAKEGSVIALFGGQGGGRDVKKLPVMGEVAAKLADIVIVTTDDPFDDDPKVIAEKIARGAETHGKVRGENLLIIPDRREAIRKAFSLAKAHDAVLVTGKGAEQSMVTKGGNIPWDDRSVVREELRNLGYEVQ